MKTFVYPAVLFKDNETGGFSIAIYDLALFTGGDSVESAHRRMEAMLTEYFKFVISNNLEYNEPTPFEKVIEKYSKQLCILVEAKVSAK